MLYLQPVSTIISVFRPFSLTKIERSALLNDITGSFSSSSELSLSHVLTPRTLSRRFFEGLCRCRFWLKLDSAPLRLEQKSFCRCPTSPFCSRCIWSWLPRIRSRCGHPLRTDGRTYVGFDGSFWLLRTRWMGIGFSGVFFCSTCYQKWVLCRILLTSWELLLLQ